MLEREAEGTPSASLAPRVALGGRGAGTRHCSAPFMQGGGPLAPGGQGRGGSLRLASERGVGSWAKAPAFPEGPGQWQAGHGAHAQECGTLHLCPSVRPVAQKQDSWGQLPFTAILNAVGPRGEGRIPRLPPAPWRLLPRHERHAEVSGGSAGW